MQIKITEYNTSVWDGSRQAAMWMVFTDLRMRDTKTYIVALSAYLHENKTELDVIYGDRTVFYRIKPCT